MASKTVANLRDSVSGMLQGLNLNNVTNLNTAFERVARQVCVKLDIPEAQLRSNISLYDGVTDYSMPSNIFATAVTDVRPQGVTRFATDVVQKQFSDQFDMDVGYGANSTRVSFDFDKGTGTMRIVSPYPSPRIEIDPMTGTTGWAVDGTVATTLVADQTVYWQAPASLRFQLASGTGTLTKTTSSQDLTNYQGVGVVFLALYVPDVTNLTSITLRIGSDASNYYSVTATTGFVKAFTSGDWMLVSFDLSTATTTGTPTITAIDYTQLRFATSGSVANVRVGDLWIALPSPTTVIYQTNAIFTASGVTTPSTSITANSDTINLNDSAYAIYEIECALDIAQQQGGSLASGVIATLGQKLNGVRGYRGVLIQAGLLDMYRADNPSNEIRTIGGYYDI